MKIKDLVLLLHSLDQEADVLISSDPEGNHFQLLEDVSTQYNYKQVRGEVEIGLKRLTPELKRSGYTEEDCMKNGDPCIIFWP